MSCIYVLKCPTTLAVRYVGKTDYELGHRLSGHLSEVRCGKKGHNRRTAWIKGLFAQGLVPLIEKDFDIPEGVSWEQVERDRIAFHRAAGADLVNGTEGGIGLFKPAPEVLVSMRKKHTLSEEGLARQQENARRVGAKNAGRKKSDAERALMVERYTGRNVSEETRLKMSATRKGRQYSEAHREAIRAGKLRYEAARRAEGGK